MSDYRDGCIYAKKVKAGIVEPRPLGGKSKRATPADLYVFWEGWFAKGGEWWKLGSYRDEAIARSTAAKQARKHSFYKRFRIGKDGAEFDPREVEPVVGPSTKSDPK